MKTKKDIRPARHLKSRTGTLLKLMEQGEEDVRVGNLIDQEALFDRIETRLKARKTNLKHPNSLIK